MPASVPSSHVDLLDAPIATLATIGPDGRPQVSPSGSSPRTAS